MLVFHTLSHAVPLEHMCHSVPCGGTGEMEPLWEPIILRRKVCWIHTMEHQAAMRNNALDVHTALWVDL